MAAAKPFQLRILSMSADRQNDIFDARREMILDGYLDDLSVKRAISRILKESLRFHYYLQSRWFDIRPSSVNAFRLCAAVPDVPIADAAGRRSRRS
jgi:hypothetical protein